MIKLKNLVLYFDGDNSKDYYLVDEITEKTYKLIFDLYVFDLKEVKNITVDDDIVLEDELTNEKFVLKLKNGVLYIKEYTDLNETVKELEIKIEILSMSKNVYVE